jgi:hypothetical protein
MENKIDKPKRQKKVNKTEPDNNSINDISELKNQLKLIADKLSQSPSPRDTDVQTFTILKNLRDSVMDNNRIILESMKQTNENVESIRRDAHETNKENDLKFVAINDEIRRLYEAVLSSVSDNKSSINEIKSRMEDVEKNVDFFEEGHCSIEEREIIKQLIKQKQSKDKSKEETTTILKSELLKNIVKYTLTGLGLVLLTIILKWNDIVHLFSKPPTP